MRIVHPSHPEDAGSGSGAPNVPEGFTDTFESRRVRCIRSIRSRSGRDASAATDTARPRAVAAARPLG